jgi:plastocyanin
VKSLIVLLTLAVLVPGCSSSSQGTNNSATPHAVTIQGIAFAPSKLTVPVGTKVSWTNNDNVKHTVTSGKPGKDAIPGVSKGTGPHPSGVFDHPMSATGGAFSFTFKKPGTYTYFCRIHSSMRASIIVQ